MGEIRAYNDSDHMKQGDGIGYSERIRGVIRQRKFIAILVLVQVIIIAAIFLVYIYEKKKGMDALDTGIRVKDFSSDYIEYNNGWYIDSDITDITDQESIDILYGPFIYLPRGNYTLVVNYECDEEQQIRPYASESENSYIVANPLKLDSHLYSLSYDFKTTAPIDNFEIRTYYSGQGVFKINDIRLFRNLNGYKKVLFILFVLFLMLDICLLERNSIKLHKKEVILLASIIVIICLPLLVDGMVYPKGDTDFHLMRIEGISNELRLGQIPVRLQSLWGSGNGYPVSIYYGDILLYFPAFLRLLGFSVSFAYASYVALISVMTVMISFFSFKVISKDIDIALLMTLAYSACTYRIIAVYIGGAIGTYTSMAFLPLGAAGVYLIYTDKGDGRKTVFRGALMLAVAMAGIITSHMLTTVMAVEVLFVFCVLEIKKTIIPKTFFSMLISIGLTILLSLFFLVPFIDYYINVDVLISYDSNSIHHIQSGGIYLFQLFAFFQDPYESGNNRIPGMLLVLVFIAALFLWLFKVIVDRTDIVLIILSGLILWISTSVFPWDWITEHSGLWNFLAQVQFSSRYLALACITLTVLMGCLLEKIRTKALANNAYSYNCLLIIMAGISLMGVFVYYGQMSEHINVYNVVDGTEIPNSPRIGPEYARVDEDGEPILFSRRDIEALNAQVEIVSREGYNMNVRVHTDDMPGVIMTPFTNYKGYEARDSAGNQYEIVDDEYCKAAFIIPSHFDDVITVSFVEPWYWRASEIISLIAWVTILSYTFIRRINKKKVVVKDEE